MTLFERKLGSLLNIKVALEDALKSSSLEKAHNDFEYYSYSLVKLKIGSLFPYLLLGYPLDNFVPLLRGQTVPLSQS